MKQFDINQYTITLERTAQPKPQNLIYHWQVSLEESSTIEKELREYKYKSFDDWFAHCWNEAKGDTLA